MSLAENLQMPRQLYDEMLAQAVAELPNECCGLLAGRDVRVTHRYPLTNALASPNQYESDPKEMFVAMKDMRQKGTDLLGIYHSHPTSEPVPSRTDLVRNWYGPDVVFMIISLMRVEPRVRAWRLFETSYEEVGWACHDSV
jgi:proteasome lid subunit RPN8/RPN11